MPANPAYAAAVRDMVHRMPAARHLGFELGAIGPGSVEIVQPCLKQLTQHDGYIQGGILGCLADFAGGAAAGTLLPIGWANMTIDYTIKIVAPARGEHIVARGRIVKAGPTISVAAADIFAVAGAEETLCASALVTLRNVRIPPNRAES